jgi:hypothetical protein
MTGKHVGRFLVTVLLLGGLVLQYARPHHCCANGRCPPTVEHHDAEGHGMPDHGEHDGGHEHDSNPCDDVAQCGSSIVATTQFASVAVRMPAGHVASFTAYLPLSSSRTSGPSTPPPRS